MLVLILLWLVFMIAVPFWAWSKVEKIDVEPEGDRPADQPGTTYLIVGSDSRDDLTEEQRKELGTGRRGGYRPTPSWCCTRARAPNMLMSIPRDSIVESRARHPRSTAAFAWASPSWSPALEQQTGIRIDDYVEIGFGGVPAWSTPWAASRSARRGDTDPKAASTSRRAARRLTARPRWPTPARETRRLGDLDRVGTSARGRGAIGAEALSPWTFINPVRYWRRQRDRRLLPVRRGHRPDLVGRWALAMARTATTA